jgi:hypothetical protein
MTVLTHVSNNNTIPPEGNPSTASIAYYSVVDLGTFTPDAAGNPTAVPDVTYLTQEGDSAVVHISRDRFNLVQKNADVYFGNLPVGDGWALGWSEIRAFNVSGLVLPITEIFIIASYNTGSRHDFRSYVRNDVHNNPMPVFYSLPSPVELCGMIDDNSGEMGTLDYIDVRVFFGECSSGCETAHPRTCTAIGDGSPADENLLDNPWILPTCTTCRGKPLYISYFIPNAVAIKAEFDPLVCASTGALAARSEIRNIQNTYGGLCQWFVEMITAKYYVPTSWGIPFQPSLPDLIAAINHIT